MAFTKINTGLVKFRMENQNVSIHSGRFFFKMGFKPDIFLIKMKKGQVNYFKYNDSITNNAANLMFEDSSPEEMTDLLNHSIRYMKYRYLALYSVLILTLIGLGVYFFKAHKSIPYFLNMSCLLACVAVLIWYKTIFLYKSLWIYHLGSRTSMFFQRICDTFSNMSSCPSISLIDNLEFNKTSPALPVKQNIRLKLCHPGAVITQSNVPFVPYQDGGIYFFPNKLIFVLKGKYQACSYADLSIELTTDLPLENISDINYDQIHLKILSDIDLRLHICRTNAACHFVEAVCNLKKAF